MARKCDFPLSPAEQEIFDAYVKETNPHSICKTGARRMLHTANPDALLLDTPENLCDMMIKSGTIPHGVSYSKTRKCALYSTKLFHEWLTKKFEEGEHADTWFEPEWMEAHAV